MTTIAVEGLTMAVDSLVTCGDTRVGFTQKWRPVAKKHGGGYVAAAGDLPMVERFFDDFPEPAKGQVWGVHLKDGGEVVLYEQEATIRGISGLGYFAAGSGHLVAMGALAAGVGPVRAVEIAVELDVATGGKVWELTVSETEVDLE